MHDFVQYSKQNSSPFLDHEYVRIPWLHVRDLTDELLAVMEYFRPVFFSYTLAAFKKLKSCTGGVFHRRPMHNLTIFKLYCLLEVCSLLERKQEV